MNIAKTIALVIVTGLTVHCSNSDDSASGPNPKEIYVGDMGTLSKMSPTGARVADQKTNNGFTKIFGGTGGNNVENFINTRVKHVFNQHDMKNLRLEPNVGDILGWQQQETTPTNSDDPRTIASNDGTALWLASRVMDTPLRVIHGNDVITVDSTRVGIVALGSSYTTSEKVEFEDDSGKMHSQDIPIPAEYRLSTLVHEARHSDCTGGLPQAYVEIMKISESADDFVQKAGIEQLECGHAHLTCPAGHDFAGYPACDMETWGAYGVGAVYSLAATNNMSEGTVEHAIMEMKHLDELSRLLKGKSTAEATFSFSSPDMSHSND